MKNRKIIILIVLLILFLGVGVTYSIFHSGTSLSTVNQNIAKFIFNAEEKNAINFPITNLNPGDKQEYLFAVNNGDSQKYSNVNIVYQIILTTFHSAPYNISLYKMEDLEEPISVCDEQFSRNDQNQLVCNMQIAELSYAENNVDEYKLIVEFPAQYNDPVYSGIVDYITLEIQSWQKLGS